MPPREPRIPERKPLEGSAEQPPLRETLGPLATYLEIKSAIDKLDAVAPGPINDKTLALWKPELEKLRELYGRQVVSEALNHYEKTLLDLPEIENAISPEMASTLPEQQVPEMSPVAYQEAVASISSEASKFEADLKKRAFILQDTQWSKQADDSLLNMWTEWEKTLETFRVRYGSHAVSNALESIHHADFDITETSLSPLFSSSIKTSPTTPDKKSKISHEEYQEAVRVISDKVKEVETSIEMRKAALGGLQAKKAASDRFWAVWKHDLEEFRKLYGEQTVSDVLKSLNHADDLDFKKPKLFSITPPQLRMPSIQFGGGKEEDWRKIRQTEKAYKTIRSRAQIFDNALTARRNDLVNTIWTPEADQSLLELRAEWHKTLSKLQKRYDPETVRSALSTIQQPEFEVVEKEGSPGLTIPTINQAPYMTPVAPIAHATTFTRRVYPEAHLNQVQNETLAILRQADVRMAPVGTGNLLQHTFNTPQTKEYWRQSLRSLRARWEPEAVSQVLQKLGYADLDINTEERSAA